MRRPRWAGRDTVSFAPWVGANRVVGFLYGGCVPTAVGFTWGYSGLELNRRWG